ncbi:hypothetical protein A4U88_0799 [Serratia marcescens]|nr:hypothetical protein A4U88_0799 [Serratia marcescens]
MLFTDIINLLKYMIFLSFCGPAYFSTFNSNLLNIFITVIRLCWCGKARNVAA